MPTYTGFSDLRYVGGYPGVQCPLTRVSLTYAMWVAIQECNAHLHGFL
jgi:hypothetical protein